MDSRLSPAMLNTSVLILILDSEVMHNLGQVSTRMGDRLGTSGAAGMGSDNNAA